MRTTTDMMMIMMSTTMEMMVSRRRRKNTRRTKKQTLTRSMDSISFLASAAPSLSSSTAAPQFIARHVQPVPHLLLTPIHHHHPNLLPPSSQPQHPA
jgi:hypothetical protein